MKCEADRFPVVENSNQGLGVRSDPTDNCVDIKLDSDGFVVLDGRGMSVMSGWRKLPGILIPSRLRDKCQKARGDDQVLCFAMGEGPFEDSPVTDQLELRKDKEHHGCIVPVASVLLSEFESKLAGTRLNWFVDEE